MTQIVMIRHGEPDYSHCDERGFIGHGRDLAPLSEKGVKEVGEAAHDPRFKGGQIILSSPYTRALQSAAILSRALDREILVEVDLHEWMPDITFQYGSVIDAIHSCRDFNRNQGQWPEGETCNWEELHRLRTRVRTVVDKYLGYDKVILVCHGMVMRSLKYVDNIPYAGIVECEYAQGCEPTTWEFE